MDKETDGGKERAEVNSEGVVVAVVMEWAEEG